MSEESKTIILACDDDLDTLNIIKIKLEAQGYKVITARDGQQALSLVRQHKPDLVILDVMMPKLSGFKVARLIKFDSKSKQTPLILLTARTQEADRALGSTVGAELYMTKPFDPENLLKEVQRLLTSKAA
jgi:two-component system alkaline phosphatase synthesis response regulator PhoP/two-component system response regulator VicR